MTRDSANSALCQDAVIEDAAQRPNDRFGKRNQTGQQSAKGPKTPPLLWFLRSPIRIRGG